MAPRFSINGVIVLDKPVGFSSNQCLQQVKRLLKADKAGHTGALDPLACGVLPLCFGEATKVAQYLLDSDKTYRTVVHLGVRTTSGDRDGEIVETRPVAEFSNENLLAVLDEFTGTITQQPSIYSALKQNGVPLYKLARAGKEIIPKFREIQIHSIELLRWESPELELRVRCSKGSYIRTLAEDIGTALKCGAHVSFLQREQAGPFSLANSITLEALKELLDAQPELPASVLLPMDFPLQHLPSLQLHEADKRRLRQGQVVMLGNPLPNGLVRVYADHEFIGIGEVASGSSLTAKRLVSYTVV